MLEVIFVKSERKKIQSHEMTKKNRNLTFVHDFFQAQNELYILIIFLDDPLPNIHLYHNKRNEL